MAIRVGQNTQQVPLTNIAARRAQRDGAAASALTAGHSTVARERQGELNRRLQMNLAQMRADLQREAWDRQDARRAAQPQGKYPAFGGRQAAPVAEHYEKAGLPVPEGTLQPERVEMHQPHEGIPEVVQPPQLTPQAQNQVDILQGEVSRAVANGELDEMQAAELREKAGQRIAQIQAEGQAPPEPQLEDTFAKRVMERDGRLFQQDGTGMFSLLADAPHHPGPGEDMEQAEMQKVAEREKMRDEFINRRSDMTVGEGAPRFTPEQIMKDVDTVLPQYQPQVAASEVEDQTGEPDLVTQAAGFRGSGSRGMPYQREGQLDFFNQNPLPQQGYTPQIERKYLDPANAQKAQGLMEADGYKVRSTTREDGTVVLNAVKPRVLSYNEQIDAETQSIGEFLNDKDRRAEAFKRLNTEEAQLAGRRPTEDQIMDQLSKDYESYLKAMTDKKQSPEWRVGNVDAAIASVNRQMSPARSGFFDSNYRQVEANLYGKTGRFPTPDKVRSVLDQEWQKRTKDSEALRKMEFIHSPSIRSKLTGSPSEITSQLEGVWKQAHPSSLDRIQQAMEDPSRRRVMARLLMSETGQYPDEQTLRRAIAESMQPKTIAEPVRPKPAKKQTMSAPERPSRTEEESPAPAPNWSATKKKFAKNRELLSAMEELHRGGNKEIKGAVNDIVQALHDGQEADLEKVVEARRVLKENGVDLKTMKKSWLGSQQEPEFSGYRSYGSGPDL